MSPAEYVSLRELIQTQLLSDLRIHIRFMSALNEILKYFNCQVLCFLESSGSLFLYRDVEQPRVSLRNVTVGRICLARGTVGGTKERVQFSAKYYV